MPLVKKDKTEIYEIFDFNLKADDKVAIINFRYITFENSLPKIKNLQVFLSDNPSSLITDPSYHPTPEFVAEDPMTWGELNPKDFPKIPDPSKQLFSKIKTIKFINDGETDAYTVLKNTLYTIILEFGIIPNIEDWEII